MKGLLLTLVAITYLTGFCTLIIACAESLSRILAGYAGGVPPADLLRSAYWLFLALVTDRVIDRLP